MVHSLDWIKKKKEMSTLEHSLLHLQKVNETVQALFAAVKVIDNREKMMESIRLVSQKEHEADVIRKELTMQIAKGTLIFMGHEELLEFVYEADSIADYAHAADRYMALFEGTYTDEVKTSLYRLAELGSKCSEKLYTVVAKLTSSSKEDVVSLCSEIETLEEVADDEKRELLKAIFKGNYSPVELIILRDLTEAVEDVCDRCEISAGRIRILAATM
jgi:predicted phosphate transport protein (TIGR00153 family)